MSVFLTILIWIGGIIGYALVGAVVAGVIRAISGDDEMGSMAVVWPLLLLFGPFVGLVFAAIWLSNKVADWLSQ